MSKVRIGCLSLSEDTVFTDNGYECAAWWRKIAVKAGEYPMYIESKDIWDDGRVSGTCRPCAELPGIIVSDYFQSMLFGVPVGTYDWKQNAGKESSYFWTMYAFSLAQWAYTGKVSDGISITLADGFRIVPETKYDELFKDEMTTYDIYKE